MNPIHSALIYCYIDQYKILPLCRNVIQLDLPNNITIYNRGNISRLTVDPMDHNRAARQPPPLQEKTSSAHT
jgi:hypothetical protein